MPSLLILFYLLGTHTGQADAWGSSMYKAPSWVAALSCHWAFCFCFSSPTPLSSMANWNDVIQASSCLPFATQLRDGASDIGLKQVDSCKVYHVLQSPQGSWEWLSDFLRASWCFSFLPSGVQQVNNFNLFLATYIENTTRAQKLVHIGPKAPSIVGSFFSSQQIIMSIWGEIHSFLCLCGDACSEQTPKASSRQSQNQTLENHGDFSEV